MNAQARTDTMCALMALAVINNSNISTADDRPFVSVCMCVIVLAMAANDWGYRGGSPTAVQAWQPCPLWEPSPSHPILL